MNIEDLMQGITNQNLVQAEFIKLKAENDQLKASVERLEKQVKYWMIEAKVDHERWLNTLAEINKISKNGNS